MPGAILTGILIHGVAVWLHLHALRRMPASVFSIYLALVPAFAIVTAAVFLGERPTHWELAGSALLFAAVVVRSTWSPLASEAKE